MSSVIADALDGLFLALGNFGLAIIVASLILRLATLPLQLMAANAAEKLARLQPRLRALKQEFADDPARLRQETATALRDAGVNPWLAVIPTALQLPIFLLFYRALRTSARLSHAPFLGWIKDLALPDPYFVLPVLLAIAFYFQQRYVPNASQAMRYLPLIFGIMMLKVSAGLVLYSLTGSVFQLAVATVKRRPVHR